MPTQRRRTSKNPGQEVLAAPKNRRTATTKYDWDHLMDVFVEGEQLQDGSILLLNLKELAERYEVPYQRVREKASKQRWTDRRLNYQQKAAMERQREQRKTMVAESLAFDQNALSAAKLGMGLITARLAEIAQEHKVKQARIEDAQRRLERGEPVEKWELYSAIYPRDMETLASALDRFQTIGMRAMGTDVQRHEVTSPDGSMTNTTINVTAELHRDDPDRLALILEAMRDAGFDVPMDDNIIEAQVESDTADDA